MTHYLKIQPCYFDAVLSGEKNFEIRFNDDRGFQKGDSVWLQKLDETGSYRTGDEVLVTVTYVTNYAQKEGWVVFGFREVNRRILKENQP